MPGHPLRVVASRKEAMDYLTGQGKFAERKTFPFPSAVVLDMQLPDGTGSELVHWIRSDARFNRMAVIMLSGSARENEIHQAYSNGANSFLLKPANPKELQQTVQLIRSSWFRQDSCQGLVRPQA
jgi:CheY-like chemotaxis protein